MRKLKHIILFLNHVQRYQSCNLTYRKLAKFHSLCSLSRIPAFKNTIYYSSLKSSTQKDPPNGLKQLYVEFPYPRQILQKLVKDVFCVHQISDMDPIMTEERIHFGKHVQEMWQVTLKMNWPEKFEVQGIASKKSEAETIAFLYACQKMKDYGKLDDFNKPVIKKKNSLFGEQIMRQSKGSLSNIFLTISMKRGDKQLIPKFNSFRVRSAFWDELVWETELHLNYPEHKKFEGFGSRINEAESVAASKALQWLQEKGIINNKLRLMHYTKEDEKKMLDYQNSSYPIFLPKNIQDKMPEVFHKLEIIQNVDSFAFEQCDVLDDREQMQQVFNVLTDMQYNEYSEDEHIARSREMFERQTWLKENSEPKLLEIKQSTSSLPIALKRKEIMELLDNNQVVVLSGETGCGKTTQVPQFILEHYVSQMKGSQCNIVVTQPRRISAISIANRVANERGEMVGETIGYQVRLKKSLPTKPGAVLFCSTGMLLRKLCTNPTLEGVSHVIIDEAHERNIQIDFLLILIKNLLLSNQKIKVLLMSATFNTQIFSTYFNNCPVIYVPGCIFPVKEVFLEDLVNIKNKHLTRKDPTLDPNLIADVIHNIHMTQKSGAILCFLPGWQDIKIVEENLLSSGPNASTMKIYPIHSRLPHEVQKLIFDEPPTGIRKIILATNIAETSITVKDVRFVVNSGLHKGTSFDCERGISSLTTKWITKSNVRQRRGRAGRVQSGVCFNLFTRKVFMEMKEYPNPELLCMPLENVILDCKLYCPDVKSEEFLSLAIQPPTRSAVQFGIRELQLSNVLDEEENLTPLGKIVVNFASHPKLSVALVYAAFLKCLDPVLTICAMLTHSKEPFVNTLEDKRLMKEIKQRYDNLLYSDHLALYKLYNEWENLLEVSDRVDFEKENRLDYQSLDFIKQLKHLFAKDLFDVGLIQHVNAYNDAENDCNTNSNNAPTVLAALTAGFYPNIIKIIQGEISNGKLKKDSIIYSLKRSQKAYIQKESVASGETEVPSPWLVYFSSLRSEERRLMMTPMVSCIPGVNLLLFAGRNVTRNVNEDRITDGDVTLMVDDWKKMRFCCSESEANILVNCREHLDNFFKIYLRKIEQPSSKVKEVLNLYESHFFPALLNILNVPHIPFIQGQKLKFENGELLSENL